MRWNAVKIIFAAYFLHLFAVNPVNCVELFIFTAFSVFLLKRICLRGFEHLTSCMPSIDYPTAPIFTYLFVISCDFKSDWVNVRMPMRWIFVRNAVKIEPNICKKMRWNAVKFSFSSHSPHSAHFIKKNHRIHRNS